MNGKKRRSDVETGVEFPGANRENFSDVLGVPVQAFTVSDFTEWLIARAAVGDGISPAFVTYLNAACSNIAADDADYNRLLKSADCVYADGQAIVWAARYHGGELPERVNAGDFITDFCRTAAAKQMRIALVGGRPGVAARAVEAWRRHVPDLMIAGTWNGFFEDDGEAVMQAVAASGADILLVGMGVPLQEKWAWPRRNHFGVKVIWCVGALFEYYGEGRSRAPVWVRRAGLEWLFRLALEPRRLWKRYLVGNVRFVWRVMKH